ncbi:olfactory receptor 6M1-like [Gastrophryne carolinensis]
MSASTLDEAGINILSAGQVMDGANVTVITVIRLLGLQTPNKTLHCPMYFFLSQLSVSDLILSSAILPVLLHIVLVTEARLPFSACMTQFFFFSSSEGVECLLLALMGYDRYLAICRPLHYRLIMNYRFCSISVITIWTVIILTVWIYVIVTSHLQYCSENVIDHFFCDFPLILQLSCSDISLLQKPELLLDPLFLVLPLFFITASYFSITLTIFNIPSNTGKQKAFSTCSSHLTVVSMYYGSLIGVYMVPNRGQSHNITKCSALLYTVITPLMNPLVYSLRNKDLKRAGTKLITNLLSLRFPKY